jgi:hypothetical protein
MKWKLLSVNATKENVVKNLKEDADAVNKLYSI